VNAAASEDGVLAAGAAVLSVALGTVAMASVIALLVLQKRFRYADV
jgi:hypothetical protein